MNIQVNYPKPQFKLKVDKGVQQIFDSFRKKYVVLNPEEWVRQNLLQALVSNYQYPKGRIAVEKELIVNNMKKRYDVVIYDEDRKPWMVIECKAPNIPISSSTLLQASNYYKNLLCPYIMLCNGEQTFVAAIALGTFSWLEHVPAYNG